MSLTSYRAAPPRDTESGLGVVALLAFEIVKGSNIPCLLRRLQSLAATYSSTA